MHQKRRSLALDQRKKHNHDHLKHKKTQTKVRYLEKLYGW